jgi:hypothetical protein
MGGNPLTMTGILDILEAVDNTTSVITYIGFDVSIDKPFLLSTLKSRPLLEYQSNRLRHATYGLEFLWVNIAFLKYTCRLLLHIFSLNKGSQSTFHANEPTRVLTSAMFFNPVVALVCR